MKIKRILFRALGIKNYLKLISRVFYFSYYRGFLKKDPEYDCHYFVKNIITPGNHIIDIGANLGYYSVIFSRLTGKNGKVYCVEPVSLFREVLKGNIRKYPQAEIIPYALGDEDDKEIRMITPVSGKHFRHGLTKVLDNETPADYRFSSMEKMYKPSTVFSDLDRCDYIKCDVEGYEPHILPLMKDIFEKFRPVLQVETNAENKKVIDNFLLPMTYKIFYVEGKFLVPIENDKFRGDLYYFPLEKIQIISSFIAKEN